MTDRVSIAAYAPLRTTVGFDRGRRAARAYWKFSSMSLNFTYILLFVNAV